MIRIKRVYSERAMELLNRKRAGVYRMTVEVWWYEGNPNRCVLELQRVMGRLP